MKTEKTDSTAGKERKGIIIFAAAAALYLAACALVFVIWDNKMQSAYVLPVHTESAGKSDSDAIPEAEKVNINTASAEELTSISGIGTVTAKNIIEYREQNNGFLDIEELINVKGIGKKTFEKLKPYITV